MNKSYIFATIYFLILLAGSSCGIIDQLIVENEEYEKQNNPIIEEENEYDNLNWEVYNGYYIVPGHAIDQDTLYQIINNRAEIKTGMSSRIINRASAFTCLESVTLNVRFTFDIVTNSNGDILAINPLNFPPKIILNCFIFEYSKTKFEKTTDNTYPKGTYTYSINVGNN